MKKRKKVYLFFLKYKKEKYDKFFIKYKIIFVFKF